MSKLNHLAYHIERYQYKRGQNKGLAPLYKHRRGRTHALVGPNFVRFHRTNIVEVHGNGSFTLRTDGHFDSPTTREALREALRVMCMAVALREGMPYRLRSKIQ